MSDDKPFPTGEEVMGIVRRAAYRALRVGAEALIIREAADDAPNPTGTLARSGDVDGHPAEIRVTLTFKQPYFPAVHEGRQPGVIRAWKARVLAVPRNKWKGPVNPYRSGQLPQLSKDGQFVILGRKVNHPGFKGNPFLRRAVQRNLDRLQRFIVSDVIRALKRER